MTRTVSPRTSTNKTWKSSCNWSNLRARCFTKNQWTWARLMTRWSSLRKLRWIYLLSLALPQGWLRWFPILSPQLARLTLTSTKWSGSKSTQKAWAMKSTESRLKRSTTKTIWVSNKWLRSAMNNSELLCSLWRLRPRGFQARDQWFDWIPPSLFSKTGIVLTFTSTWYVMTKKTPKRSRSYRCQKKCTRSISWKQGRTIFRTRVITIW